jgi:hypothetical protein
MVKTWRDPVDPHLPSFENPGPTLPDRMRRVIVMRPLGEILERRRAAQVVPRSCGGALLETGQTPPPVRSRDGTPRRIRARLSNRVRPLPPRGRRSGGRGRLDGPSPRPGKVRLACHLPI